MCCYLIWLNNNTIVMFKKIWSSLWSFSVIIHIYSIVKSQSTKHQWNLSLQKTYFQGFCEWDPNLCCCKLRFINNTKMVLHFWGHIFRCYAMRILIVLLLSVNQEQLKGNLQLQKVYLFPFCNDNSSKFCYSV